MRIATSAHTAASDLTARARIRDAAIACFADEGFDATFRTIAARAGVSPGLITHHFGSKTALRAECDAEVLRHYQELKTDSLADPSAYLVQNLTGPSAAAPLVVYLLRAIHAGGQPAREFLEHLIDGAREVMRRGVETGVVRPSRDEEARLRYLTYQTMGALLIQFLTSPGATPEEFVRSAQAGGRDQILPTLELFTEGFLTTRRMLDDYLVFVGDLQHAPPAEHP
ncbi:TetR/AcrR family transcriptional regulator [Cellulomonas sp. URHD0024]|uniref:TetR/AcrR family transcriptional regulator n=1 Tax=Cellulomonas sp. URHD0024 TaxID=1302620 RepID=UPI000688E4B5|nr:TetR family transcriptional regulator [Cellulomonas sp. URHD0024]